MTITKVYLHIIRENHKDWISIPDWNEFEEYLEKITNKNQKPIEMVKTTINNFFPFNIIISTSPLIFILFCCANFDSFGLLLVYLEIQWARES